MARVKSNVDNSRSPVVVPYAILLVLALLGGMATFLALGLGGNATAGGTGDAVPAISDATATSFSKTGPFGVGLDILKLSENGAPVTVWYPANADAAHGVQTQINLSTLLPAAISALYPGLKNVPQDTYAYAGLEGAAGRFPLVVFSHGFSGFSTQSASLCAHLASWGFVVASPEHLDRDLTAVLKAALTGGLNEATLQSRDVTDLENTIALMGAQAEDPHSVLYRHLDMSRIGAGGHSAGGSAVEKLAVADSRVKVFVGLAGASFGSFGETASGPGAKVPNQPGMLMYGEKDGIVPATSMKNAYNAMKAPKRLIGIADAGHLVFADVCTVGPKHEGLISVAASAGLQIPAQLASLGSDGCTTGFAPIYSDQPLIKQAVTAELRWQMGFDPSQQALDGLEQAFGWQVLQNTTAPSVAGATPWKAGS